MYQYNSIMSAVNDFIDEVNESDSEAKLVKPHTIKDAYELLAGYYGKETGKALLEEYESGRPHDMADATKLLLDVLKNSRNSISKYTISDNKSYVYAKESSMSIIQTDDGINIGYSSGINIGLILIYVSPILTFDHKKLRYSFSTGTSYSSNTGNRGQAGQNGLYRFDIGIGILPFDSLSKWYGTGMTARTFIATDNDAWLAIKTYAEPNTYVDDELDISGIENYPSVIAVSPHGWNMTINTIELI